MRERHPHLYGDADEAPDWEELKARLRAGSRPDGETETVLSSLKHKFVKGLKGMRDSVLDHLVGTGFFPKRPDRVIARWGGWTFLVLIVLVILGLWQQWPWPMG